MLTGLAEPEAGQKALELDRTLLVDGEFHELGAEAFRPARQCPNSALFRSLGLELVQHGNDRAMAVDSDAPRRAGAKLIVEDFQRQ